LNIIALIKISLKTEIHSNRIFKPTKSNKL
jgi:hypothetical protein